MNIWASIKNTTSAMMALIDGLSASEQDKSTIKLQVAQLSNELLALYLRYQSQLNKLNAQVITTESQGESWLQRNWRPITMLTFLGLIVLDSFGLLAHTLPPQAWDLLQLGLGGYVIGRSVEKVAPHVLNKIKGGAS